MKCNDMLTIASLLSVLFVTLHTADDIVRGMEPGTLFDLIAVPILVVWLYGTLVLAERRSGYVIILLGSLLGLVVPVIHMKGKGVGVASGIANSSGAFFFIWTLIALQSISMSAPEGRTKLNAVATQIQYFVVALAPRIDVNVHAAEATIDANSR